MGIRMGIYIVLTLDSQLMQDKWIKAGVETSSLFSWHSVRLFFFSSEMNGIMCFKYGNKVWTYCGLFLSHSVINCSMFTLYALLNSNICLDGTQPVFCNCFYSTELVLLAYNIHELVSWEVTIHFIFELSHSITWCYFWTILINDC